MACMHNRGFSKVQYLVLLSFMGVLMYLLTPVYQVYFNQLPPAMVAGTFIDKTPILLDGRVDVMHGSWADTKHLHEPDGVRLAYSELMQRLAKKDEAILIDVGANTGSFALLPILSNKIKVIAFEPNIAVADVLRSNIKLNKIDANVTILPIGLSDHYDVLQLKLPNSPSTGLATFGKNVLRFDAAHGYSASAVVMPLDQILPLVIKHGQNIDFIKIDTEGWEYYVLLGSKQVLKTYKPHLLLEYVQVNMQQAGVEPNSLLQLLAELAYKCDVHGEDLYCRPIAEYN